MKNIYTAFIKAQKEFAPALKTSTNPHFKSKYVSLDGCIEAVIDALNNNGIGLLQLTHEAEHGVMVETVLIHESGEQLSGGKLFVPATKLDAQGFGSALTYARRYTLMATCGIAPEDDDGNAASKVQNKTATAPSVQSVEFFVKRITDTKSLDELQKVFTEIYTRIKTMPDYVDAVTKAKDEMKHLFENAINV